MYLQPAVSGNIATTGTQTTDGDEQQIGTSTPEQLLNVLFMPPATTAAASSAQSINPESSPDADLIGAFQLEFR